MSIIKFKTSIPFNFDLEEKFDLPGIALLGRSNVGKSSFINSLNNRVDVAKVSSKPGHTRLANLYQFTKKAHIIDLPGYGFAKLSLSERQNLENLIFWVIQKDEFNIHLVFQIIDAKIGPQPIDLEINQHLVHHQIPHQIIYNKVDKLNRNEQGKALQESKKYFPNQSIIPFSTITGEGKKTVVQLIENLKSN